jgi:Kef-type K+ transport system membrane component KefB/mannitol/fructose-specific phosphotransferase system IIA component (Ntr-type)/nucleotide-binding universal stress UspA family protein
MPFALPITNPVLIFAMAMGIFLLGPVIFERLRVPGLIGLIFFGAVVGPNVLNLLARDFTFVLLGQVGLLYLVFLAGLELDLNRFNEFRSRSIAFGILSFGIPMALASAVMPLAGFSLPAALLIGAIIGSHTLLAYPVVSRLGIIKNPAIITVVGGTLVTDTLALAVLAIVAGSMQGDTDALFWLRLVGVLSLYVALVFILVPRIGTWFFRNVPSAAPAEFLFLMVVLFFVAWFAQLAGAEPIIGAFLAGLTLNRLIPLNSPLMTRVRFVGNAIFIPFFLLSVGMLVDPQVLVQSAEVWVIAGLLLALVHLGKFAGAWIAKMAFRYSREEGLTMFGLSSPQAAATLAVTFVGLEIGLFGEAVVNAVIVMIVVTVFVGPWLVERYGRAVALQEERRPYDPREAPRRILIPIANPATADGLMDIAFLLRDKTSDEPIFPLTVVRGTGDDSEARVAEAEKMLSHAVLYAAGADVPVSPLTRVDPNIATGMVRAVAETRTSIVVVGWDGRSSASRTAVFGTVLDQLLEQTRQSVIVARMGHPLNTTGRMVLVLPPDADRHPGFSGAVGLIKRLAAEIDARLEVIAVGDTATPYDTILKEVSPEYPFTLHRVEGWGPLLWDLRERLGPQDLVAALSSRRGTLGWSRELERLPGQLASLVPESFLMVYPSETAGDPAEAPSDDETDVQTVDLSILPPSLSPARIVLGMDGGQDYRSAMRMLLGTHFTDAEAIETIVTRLCSGEEDFSSEVREGIALPHTMLADVDEPLIFLGVSHEGLSFPNIPSPVHAVFILLGSSRRSVGHLRLLTRTARQIREAGSLETLISAQEVGDVALWVAGSNVTRQD